MRARRVRKKAHVRTTLIIDAERRLDPRMAARPRPRALVVVAALGGAFQPLILAA